MNDTQSERFYAFCLANTQMRLAMQPIIKDMKFMTQIAQDLTKFFMTEARVLKPFNSNSKLELRGFLTENYQEDEIGKIIKSCHEFSMMDDTVALQTLLSGFQSFYTSQKVYDLEDKYSGDPTGLVKALGKLQDISLTSFPIHRLNEFKWADVQKEEFGEGGVLPSACQMITDSNVEGGYKKGQICLVVGSPGVGKSLWLMNEAIAMLKAGKKVVYMALGDLFKSDFMIRIPAIVKGIPMFDVGFNPELHFDQDEEIQDLVKNLRVAILPAGSIDAYQMRSSIEVQITEHEDADCIIIDYDGNFASPPGKKGNGDGNMYFAGEELYNIVGNIARPATKPYRLVIIASQPKNGFWECEYLPLSCAAESSKKQHICDMMVTIGRNPDMAPEVMGVMSIVKNRRGKVNAKEFYIRTPHGTFEFMDYKRYKAFRKVGNKDVEA